MNRQDAIFLRNVSDQYRSILFDRVLPFWYESSFDRQHGGALTCVDFDGQVYDETKSVWFQGRVGWMFATAACEMKAADSTAATSQRAKEYFEFARSCCDFIERCCIDNRKGSSTEGKLYFTVSREGAPLRMRRYVFSESFAAIAHAAVAKACALFGVPSAVEHHRQRALYYMETYCRHSFTPGVMPPKFEATAPPALGIGPFMIAMVTAQELRLTCSGAEEPVIRLDEESILCPHLKCKDVTAVNCTNLIAGCIDVVLTKFVKHDLKVVMEVVNAKTSEVIDDQMGRCLNPGHAIEAAWFIQHEGKLQQNSKWIKEGELMLQYMYDRGWDAEFGGLLSFVDVTENQKSGVKPCQVVESKQKFWWPHNELMIASLLALQLSTDPAQKQRFLKMFRQTHTYFFDKFPVKGQSHGEVYGYLSREGKFTNRAVGGLFKGPFHYPRALLVCSQLASAVADQHTASKL